MTSANFTWKHSIWILILLLVGAVGLISGGSLRSRFTKPPVKGLGDRPPIPHEYELVVKPGDLFPNAECLNLSKARLNFGDLWGKGPTVLLFWAMDCGPCEEQAELWNLYMVPRLNDDVQQVVCVPMGDSSLVNLDSDELSGKLLLFIDMDKFYTDYNLTSYPTIVSVDRVGRITHIQYESAPAFDEEFLSYLASE